MNDELTKINKEYEETMSLLKENSEKERNELNEKIKMYEDINEEL